ncbi:MAG: hypothetical protein KDK33_03725 [Leptospiraceae bacterium]|nr:hypothetical protein [Leptospiraceae bacterium]
MEERGYATPENGLYVHSDPPFSIVFPAGWKIEQGSSTYIRAISPFENPQDNFRESVSLILLNQGSNLEIDELYTINRDGLANKLKNYQVLSETDISIAGGPGKLLEISFGIRDGVIIRSLFGFATIEADEGVIGILFTCTATRERYDQYGPIFRRTIASLKTGPPQEIKERKWYDWQ